ncbi:hypothetical protein ACJW30_11G000600 [Castanea mollissima]
MAHQLYGYNPSSSSSASTSSVYGAAATPTHNASSYTTSSSRSLSSDQYVPSSIRYSSAAAAAAKYSTSAAMYDGGFHYSTSSSTPNSTSHLASQSSWSDASDALAAFKRSSDVLYHQTVLGAHNTIGQTEAWYSTNSLAKRPRFDSASNLPIYPQRPGEKDCAHYMLTRTCKFGDSCRFDHPIWVPEGGIPDWKEVPPLATTTESLPERPGMPDCPFFLKTQRCKFGLRCKFNHPKDKLVTEVAAENAGLSALPERPSEPPCAFYMKTGKCKFGPTCKFNHPKDIQIPLLGQENGNGEQTELTIKALATADAILANSLASYTPALIYNSKGLPVRPGEADCPFYLKTGSCKYGATCRYNHPDRHAINPPAAAIGLPIVASPATNLNIGVVNPAASIYQTIDPRLAQPTVGPTIYPQRPGQIECDFYMKTGECKFGENCKFHHPIDRSAPSLLKQAQQQAVKLTLAGLPRREGAVLCPYYLKTGTCKFGATCKFDHPPPGEVMAMATSQGTSAAVEGDEKEVELLQEQQQ